ncbi:MAG: hypothetical protein H6868_02540 [Rhodospirillales bacterium]|nr:hypothetical protein [Rhodospirillales bacterium]
MGKPSTNVIPFLRPAFTETQDSQFPAQTENPHPFYLDPALNIILRLNDFAARFTGEMHRMLKDLNIQHYTGKNVFSHTIGILLPLDSEEATLIIDSYIADLAENAPDNFRDFLERNAPEILIAYEEDHDLNHVHDSIVRDLYLKEMLRRLQQETVLDELMSRNLPEFQLSFDILTADDKAVLTMTFNWDEDCDARQELQRFLNCRSKTPQLVKC